MNPCLITPKNKHIQMQYDPKLKMAMEDIKAILKKYDIAAVVVLHNIQSVTPKKDGSQHAQGHSEYYLNIEPSYSAAKFNAQTGQLQVKGKKEHYSTVEERNRKIASTVNMAETLAISTGKMAMMVMDMEEMIKKCWPIEYSDPGDDTSHTQQNN
jgi:hypothetical protein